MPNNIIYDWIAHNDVTDALKIELEGYPSDEAASLEAFQYRQAQAGDLFLGAYIPSTNGRELVGYICATLSPSTTLTHESMTTHVPSSASVCIHSVCVAKNHRRKQIALNLLKEYILRLEAARKAGKPYERVLLITHEPLRQLYERAGFEWAGKSEVVHGSEPWYEMRKDLGSGTHTVANPEVPQMPAGLWDALQHSSTRTRPSARSLSDFGGNIDNIVRPHSQESAVLVNKFDLLCPRNGCGSIILKAGVGKWVERASVQMEPQGHPSHPNLPILPVPPAATHWWLVTPSPMEFENIGFSRPLQQQSSSSPKMKLLACAECDLGPLGWTHEGGTEFWLACSRVGYRE
ncbi:acyl-CoA N-acyltransferase [Collybia nuda]|uniref:Acyl-CoA N-acyltransferase n=1 Tax=Collybia nuda TaxID=64659 RepID=A0A9P6CQ97_9AGAR|nr:acyl-CoA N-acyltransferase [Collybia nuda]